MLKLAHMALPHTDDHCHSPVVPLGLRRVPDSESSSMFQGSRQGKLAVRRHENLDTPGEVVARPEKDGREGLIGRWAGEAWKLDKSWAKS